MRYIKNLTLMLVALTAVNLMSCKKDSDGDDPATPKELTIEALAGTWTLSDTDSFFGNTDLDATTVGVSVTETGFTLSGEVTDFVSAGTFSVTDEGSISEVTLTVGSDDLELGGDATVVLNGTKDVLTITFSLSEASGRVGGLGDYRLVFNKQS